MVARKTLGRCPSCNRQVLPTQQNINTDNGHVYHLDCYIKELGG